MKLIHATHILALGLATAAPTGNILDTSVIANNHLANLDADFPLNKRSSPRFSCGQYKFDDGIVQEFYSQVWAGYPADQMICRYFKYEFHDKKGQDGKMVAAKVDKGCTCFFYASPCDPNKGIAERWEGWMGWENYAGTDKSFKGWYCFEQN